MQSKEVPTLDGTECLVTFEVMKTPVVLPCGHSFERSAIKRLIKESKGDGKTTAKCPLCRKEFRTDEKLPINYGLKKARDGHNEATAEAMRRERCLLSLIDPTGTERLKCPIGNNIMKDPVKADDGHTYDRKNIQEWIDSRRSGETVVSPLDKGKMMGTNLTPDVGRREMIRQQQLGTSQCDKAHDDAPVKSICVLNNIFSTLDHLDDILKEVLHVWEPPWVVVAGNQSHGTCTCYPLRIIHSTVLQIFQT